MAERANTTKALKKLETQLECSICLDYLSEPKILPCFHVFCKSPCLEKLVTKDGRSLTCPTCRSIIPLSERGVAGLQSDFHIDGLFDIRDAFNKADDDDDNNRGNNEAKATNYDLLTQHKAELVSSLKPVKEKLETVQQALKKFDTRVKVIQDQKALIEADIQREIDLQHALLDQRKTELMEELDMLTKHKLKALATQKDHVEMTEAKLSSCIKYAEGGLETTSDGEVLEMKASINKRVEQISAEFDSSTLPPEVMADMKMVSQGKKHLQQAYQGFLSIDHGLSFSSENSKTMGDGLKYATMGKTKSVYFEPKNEINKKFEGQIGLKAELVHLKSQKKQKCEVVAQNGGYEISYRPVYRGKHELHISVNEVPVQESPFPITVMGLLRKPVRVVRGFKYPRSVVVNSKGQLVVLDDNGTSASVMIAGEQIRNFKGISNAYGVTVDKDDNIYVVQHKICQIKKFSAEGELLATAGSYGSGRNQLNYPVGICYSRVSNKLYVNDNCNHRIQVLTTDLKFVQCFGNIGTENGQFRYPHYAAFDSQNKLYVTDNENGRVQVFTADGQFLKAFSQKSSGAKLNRPWAIAIDSSDTVYVSENGSHCVSVFTSQGEYITTIGGYGSEKGQFYHPWGLCVNRNDSVIVSDYNNCLLKIF